MAFPAAIPSYTPADPDKTLDEDNHTQRHNSMQEDIVNIATKVGIDASADTTSHDYRIAQLEDGAGGNYSTSDEAVTGTQNGSNTVFTTSQPYIGGSLEVFINGLKQTRGTHLTETSPVVGTFTLDTAPESTDIIRVNYMFASEVGTIDADTVDGYHAAGILSAAEATMLAAIAAAKEALYPVGSLYMNSSVSTNPATLLGFGTWVAIQDKMIMAVGSTYAASTSGGAATHTHQASTMGAHWNAFLSTSRVYMDYETTTVASYTENGRAYVDGSAETVGAHSEASTSALKVSGATDSASSLPPYETAYIWKRTA